MKLPLDTADSDGPNLTPVIDVVFLLLIFFLVATQYNQEERELDITLPEVAEAQPLSMTSEIIVNITDDGKYKVATKEYSEAQLLSLLSQAKKNNPHQTTLIRGDGESDLKFAVRVMGMCNKVQMDYRIAALQER
jgi:biopolymer transport protein ExbD